MSAGPEEREVRRLVKEHGEFIRKARHGDLYKFPNGQTIMVYPDDGRSRGDPRAWKNSLADIRRTLKSSHTDTPIEQEEDQTMDQNQLAQLGIHVQPDKEVRVTTKTATLDAKGLATLLGVREGETKVFLLDDEGKNPCEVQTLQLRIVTTTEL